MSNAQLIKDYRDRLKYAEEEIEYFEMEEMIFDLCNALEETQSNSKSFACGSQRIGCIGSAYCPDCRDGKTGTCLCALICPDCGSKMTEKAQ